MIYTVKYFRPEEFQCKHCGMGGVVPMLVFYLDMIRAAYGKPIHITSGFRCAEHNKAVGGSRRSRHMIGCAADIRDTNDSVLSAVLNAVFDMPKWERILGNGYFHVGAPRMVNTKYWTGGKLDVIVINHDSTISQRVLVQMVAGGIVGAMIGAEPATGLDAREIPA